MWTRLAIAAAAATAAAVWFPGPAAASSGGVLVVGDSLEVGTGPYLRQQLPGIPVTVDALKSRSSSVGLAVLSSRLLPSHGVVIFDLGVNDDPAQPQALAGDLATARGIVGDRCLVVATLSRPPYNGVSVDGLNRAVRSFVAASPPAQLADWRAVALATPGALQPDGVHGTPTGYALRAQVIAEAVYACLAGPSAHLANPPPPPAQQPPPRPAKGAAEPRRERTPGLLAALVGQTGGSLASLLGSLRSAIEAWFPPSILRHSAGPAPPAY
jgi:hypothetical protein